ncbi:MAG: hypothetical protein ABFS42_03860 [Candidatus Krumholzibacteriota bacterium]
MKIRGLINFPWYPLLIAVLPLVHFYEANFRAFFPADFLRVAVLFLALSGLLLLAAGLVWKNRHRAAPVTALLTAVLVAGNELGGWLSAALVITAVVSGIFLTLRKPDLTRVTPPLNAAFLVLALLPVLTAWWTDRGETPPSPTAQFAQPLPVSAAGAVKPDIWFLLMDGLGSPAFIEREFELDANLYSGQLRRRGFRVPDVSRANYQQTGLSVSATWNVAHIPALLDVPDTSSRDRRVLYDMIADSRVLRALTDLGYRTVNVPSSYPMTRLRHAEAHREPFFAPNMIEFAILEKGVLPLVQPLLGAGPADLAFALRRRNLEYVFDNLPAAREAVPDDEPALVFAHVMAPHPPFVFDAAGGARRSEKRFEFFDGSHWLDLHGWAAGHYPEKYHAQAIYVMRRLGEAVDQILAQATRPTVIIVQGDHGPGSRLDWEKPEKSDHRERFEIFNGWYLPPGMEAELPEGVTALATFPILFKALFGTEMAVPADRFLIARWSRPYVFFEVRQ